MSELNGLRYGKNLLFVNKKKQKNFVNLELGYGVPVLSNKSFLLLFFKKEAFLRRFNARPTRGWCPSGQR